MTGNHAQALSLAAYTFNIPAYIVMPSISTPSKIAATQALTPHVIFSGSTSQEREAKVKEVIGQTGAVLIPPYDHGDIILGQGTVGLEMEQQFAGRREGQVCTVYTPSEGEDATRSTNGRVDGNGDMHDAGTIYKRPSKQLDAIIASCGGGGLLSGIATLFFDDDHYDDGDDGKNGSLEGQQAQSLHPTATPSISLGQPDEHTQPRQQPPHPLPPSTTQHSPPTHQIKLRRRQTTPLIFGAEPTYQGADDARRSLHQGRRIESVKSLTIADGLRTPLGVNNWSVISNPAKVRAIYGVSEEDIKQAMRLLMERAKWVVEPSAAVGLAVVLFNEGFRGLVQRLQEQQQQQQQQQQQEELEGEAALRPWNIGVVLSGGNTTIDAIVGLFGGRQTGGEENEVKAEDGDKDKNSVDGKMERQQGKIDMDGLKMAENVAG
jgi:threonine dehydratase